MKNKDKKMNKLTDFEKLQLLFKQFLMLNDKSCKMNFKLSSEATSYVKLNMAKYMFKLYGHTGLPKVVGDEDYEQMKTSELYRGVPEIEYIADLLNNENNYVGFWGNGIGTFCTPKKEYANFFAGKSKNILSFKYFGNILSKINNEEEYELYYYAMKRGSNLDEIKDEQIRNKCQVFRKFFEELDKGNFPKLNKVYVEYALGMGKQDFLELMLNETFLSVYLGFDGYEFYNVGNKYEVVLFNLSKIVVSLSMYNKICAEAEKFKTETANNLIP